MLGPAVRKACIRPLQVAYWRSRPLEAARVHLSFLLGHTLHVAEDRNRLAREVLLYQAGDHNLLCLHHVLDQLHHTHQSLHGHWDLHGHHDRRRLFLAHSLAGRMHQAHSSGYRNGPGMLIAVRQPD